MEQIMDMRYTLHVLGVPVIDSYMFGDNQSVLTQQHSTALTVEQASS